MKNNARSVVCWSRGWECHSRGQFHKQFCALTPNFSALRPTFEKLLLAQKFGVGRKTVFEIDLWSRITLES